MKDEDNPRSYYYVVGCLHNYLGAVKDVYRSFEIPPSFNGVLLKEKKVLINFPNPDFEKTKELVAKAEQEYKKLTEAITYYNETNN